jgi:hypothetical protein
LHTKNLRTRRPSKGLNNVKVRLFLISKQNRPVTFTLELLADAKIYLRFYVSLLEPADPETPLQKTFHYEMEEEDKFEVEKILAWRTIGRTDF